MGVTGLWKLLEPTGKPVTLESLQGKILAIVTVFRGMNYNDLSLWIHQAMRGCAGRSNERNGHLIVLFNRIAKLMFYGIKPIVVFDGPNVPEFKKIVLSKRQMKRSVAALKLSSIQKKILHKLAAEAVSANYSPTKINNEDTLSSCSPEKRCRQEEPMNSSESFEIDEDISDDDEYEIERNEHYTVVPIDYDFNSEQFMSLPPSVQLDILLSLTNERQRSAFRMNELPDNSDDFSKFQLQNLLKKNQINEKLERVQKDLAASDFVSDNLPDSSNYSVKNVFHGDQRRHLLLQKLIESEKIVKDGNLSAKIVEVEQKDETANKKSCEIKLDICRSVDDSFSNDLDVDHFDDHECESDIAFGFVDNDITDLGEPKPQFDSPTTNIMKNVSDYVEEINKVDIFYASANISSKNREIPKAVDITDKNAEIEILTSKGLDSVSFSDTLVSNFENSEIRKQKDLEKENFTSKDLPAVSFSDKLVSKSLENCSAIRNKDTIATIDSSDEDDDFVEVPGLSSSAINKHTSVIDISLTDIFPSTSKTKPAVAVKKLNPKLAEIDTFVETHESLEELRAQRQKAEAVDKTLTSQIMEECEAVLKLFGIPFVYSPGEAEAQCAAIERSGLSQGTVTDDSDIWLFGGKTVYRHVFNKKQFVHEFNYSLIQSMLGLPREKLIQIALLVGCDYTVGVNSVGVVSAVEILSEFSTYDDNCVDLLEKFKSWWEQTQVETKSPGNMVRARLAKLRCEFPGSFPDKAVFKAFVEPTVTNFDKNILKWVSPDLDGLRDFAFSTFGWSKSKTDEILLPALKRFFADQKQENKNQTLITNFAFNVQSKFGKIDESALLLTSRCSRAFAKLKNNKNSKKVEDFNEKSGKNDEKKKVAKKRSKVKAGLNNFEDPAEIDDDCKAANQETLKKVSKKMKVRSLPQQRRNLSRKSKLVALKQISSEACSSAAALSSDSNSDY